MKLKPGGKKLLLGAVAAVLALAVIGGIAALALNGGETIGVYAFNNIGITEYWGDSRESYGPVTTDRIQTVYLSDTQTVTEVLVSQGDTVHKGDVLMTFDTTLSGLQLERKRLEVEKQKLQLEEAEKALNEIRGMKAMEISDTSYYYEEEEDLGTVQLEDYRLYITAQYNGLSQDTPFVCWVRDDAQIDIDALLREMHNTLGLTYLCPHNVDAEQCEICNPPLCVHGELKDECEICSPEICAHGNRADTCPYCTCEHGKVRGSCPICSPEVCIHGNLWGMCPTCNGYPGLCEHGYLQDDCDICNSDEPDPTVPSTTAPEQPDPTVPSTTAPEETQEPTTGGTELENTDPADANSLSTAAQTLYRVLLLSSTEESGTESTGGFYVVFKITQENAQWGATTFWQGLYVRHSGNSFILSFFTPAIEDYTIPEKEEEETEEIVLPDIGSGYTAAQLAQLRKDQEATVKELTLKAKMAEAEYKIMERELSDGNIYADFDGEVVSLLSEEESRDYALPMLKVSGGGGFYIQGSVSELEKDNLQVGQEVTVNDWNTGMVYTGTIQSVGDFPSSSSYYNGLDNPTASYYPFTVFVDGSADLQEGNYVSVEYSAASSASGVYLYNPFLRTEQGRSYVYVRGADGLLEKRYVTVGKSLWGSYTEIVSGITEEDYLAFPYGKGLKDGARTEEGNLYDLYSY